MITPGESNQLAAERFEKASSQINLLIRHAMTFLNGKGRVVPIFTDYIEESQDTISQIMQPYRDGGWKVQVNYIFDGEIGWLILLIPPDVLETDSL